MIGRLFINELSGSIRTDRDDHSYYAFDHGAGGRLQISYLNRYCFAICRCACHQTRSVVAYWLLTRWWRAYLRIESIAPDAELRGLDSWSHHQDLLHDELPLPVALLKCLRYSAEMFWRWPMSCRPSHIRMKVWSKRQLNPYGPAADPRSHQKSGDAYLLFASHLHICLMLVCLFDWHGTHFLQSNWSKFTVGHSERDPSKQPIGVLSTLMQTHYVKIQWSNNQNEDLI